MNNITLLIEDNNKKAKAYLSVDDKELTIQVVTEVMQCDFVLSEDDLKLIDFLRNNALMSELVDKSNWSTKNLNNGIAIRLDKDARSR